MRLVHGKLRKYAKYVIFSHVIKRLVTRLRFALVTWVSIANHVERAQEMKRAKSKKAKDFPKKRRKVGKGRIPENATTVSFTTKAVVVPTQLEETREPTTKRKLSLQVGGARRSCLYNYNNK